MANFKPSPAAQAFQEISESNDQRQWFRERVVNAFSRDFPGYSRKMAQGEMTRSDWDWLNAFMKRSEHNTFVGALHQVRFMPQKAQQARDALLIVYTVVGNKYADQSPLAEAFADCVISFLRDRKDLARRVSNVVRGWELAQVNTIHTLNKMKRDIPPPPFLLGYNPTQDI